MTIPLTPPQAAKLANLSDEHIRQPCRQGKIPATKHGNNYAIDPDKFRTWMIRRIVERRKMRVK